MRPCVLQVDGRHVASLEQSRSPPANQSSSIRLIVTFPNKALPHWVVSLSSQPLNQASARRVEQTEQLTLPSSS
jgi:hypothetical protein